MNRPVTRSISAELRARVGANSGNSYGVPYSMNSMEVIPTSIQSRHRSLETIRENNEEALLRAVLETTSNQNNNVNSNNSNNDLMNLVGSSQAQVNRISSEDLFQAWLSTNSETLANPELPSSSPNVNMQFNMDVGTTGNQNFEDTRRVSGDLSSLIASFQQSKTEQQKPPENASDLNIIGRNWMLDNRGMNNVRQQQQESQQSLLDKLAEIQRQEDQRVQQNRIQSTPSPLNILSSWRAGTPMTRSKSAEIRRIIGSSSSSVPSTDDILNVLAQLNQESSPSFHSLNSPRDRGQNVAQNSALQKMLNSLQQPKQTIIQEESNLGGGVSAVVNKLKGNLEKKKFSQNRLSLGPLPGDSSWNLPSPSISNQRQRFARSPDPSNGTGQLSVTVGSPSSSSGQITPTGGGTLSEFSSGQAGNQAPFRPQTQLQQSLAGKRRLQSFAEAEEETVRKRQEVMASGGNNKLAYPAGKLNSKTNKQTSLASGHRSNNSLMRTPSVNSSGTSAGGANPSSKQHRVERARKMLEAKSRNKDVPVTADAEALKKKCEALETEVRSLKTFQSFMNRKDSEQTTKIEELEAKNRALTEERDKLLDELASLKNG